MIIIFPGHKLLKCKRGEECADSCAICGGLSLCTVCGGGEASLPSDCPGERMHEILQDEVQAGEIDYRRKQGWVRKPNYLRSRHYKGEA